MTAADRPSVTDNARAEAAVARALFIEDNAPMARPGNGDYDFFSQRWEERHASGNSRTSADYRYKARVALAALDEWAAGRAETTTDEVYEAGYKSGYHDGYPAGYGAARAETTTATDEDAARVIRPFIEAHEDSGYDLDGKEVSESAQRAADALLAAGLLATARTRPTREALGRTIFGGSSPSATEMWEDVMPPEDRERFYEAADRVLALLADQPTEAEAGARALEQAADTLGTRGRMSPQALRDRAADLRGGDPR